jgi:recombination protein RecA
MAKKPKDNPDNISTEEGYKQIVQYINKQYGAGSCVSGQNVANRDLKVINWSPSLDLSLSGGVLEGTWISVSGPPKFGKTAMLLKLAVNMQKAGKRVYWLTPEGRIKRKDLENVKGLDLAEDKFIVVQSTMEKIFTCQDYLKATEYIMKTDPLSFIAIDSISALADERMIEGGFETQLRGGQNIPISNWINNIGQYVSASGCILAGVVHKIANTSGFGASSSEKACNRWKYQADVQLEVKYIDKWKRGEEIIGQILHIDCKSSALGRPFMGCDTHLRYGIGIDDVFETLQYGLSCGLVELSGSWYTFPFAANYPEIKELAEQKIQGGEAAWELLNSNPVALQYLMTDLVRFSKDLVINEK